ncbi:hypothetical protein N790_11870 [Arenimonas malthae CC-JY-1]|uniref:OmpR/PhoB-type domain-containing protein n=1 Tax=Arenimonas malthae CC-JY-1 TaxID=1384054 RepID=A0A091BCI6_9GAMM|nr:hypothetical protein N790_11870 [Arenimonas malthae CC-JY-1]
MDVAGHVLTRGGQVQPIEPKAFSVLVELLRHAGETVGRDQLLDAVWGHRHVTPGVLTRAIAQARTALADDSHHPRYIQTRHSVGYRFIGQLEPPPGDAVAPAAVPAPPPERHAASVVAGIVASPDRLGRRRADHWRHWRWALVSAALAAALAWGMLHAGLGAG